MSKFTTVKLNSDPVSEARRDAEVFRRSLGSQIEHWARLGRAIENADGFSTSQVRAALKGRLKMDELSDADQDAFFGQLGSLFEAPPAEVSHAYADLGKRRQSAQSARKRSDAQRNKPAA